MPRDATYSRGFRSTPEINGNTVIGNFMSILPQSIRHKRQGSELNRRNPSAKTKLLRHNHDFQTPPAFWDNLSKVWLTKRALKEFDRRNTVVESPSLCPKSHESLAHRTSPKPKRHSQTSQSTPYDFFHHATKNTNYIKQFARHGGPNLTDIRGVWAS